MSERQRSSVDDALQGEPGLNMIHAPEAQQLVAQEPVVALEIGGDDA
jgi:hypothetical protein